MNTIIEISGWTFIAIVLLLVSWWAWEAIYEWLDRRKDKKDWKTIKDFGNRVYDCRYWLNQPDHRPYRKLFEFIINEMKFYGTIRGNELRDQVNKIIGEQEEQK